MARQTAPDEAYQLKVTLLGSKPPIWRRLLVPAGTTLEQLHRILQMAMGWTDSHMHEFRANGIRYAAADPFGDDFGEPPAKSEKARQLFQVFGGKGTTIDYTYDFGDGWEHRIVLEKVLPLDPEGRYPVCLAGKLNCPPEDCGGLGGYYNLLEALQNPGHPEHEELLEWIGGRFDPNTFSVDEVNEILRPRRSRRSGA